MQHLIAANSTEPAEQHANLGAGLKLYSGAGLCRALRHRRPE
ncbi:MAG: hypothetical protein M5R42_05440 [Rhodocyclaceae bacterium]|nr:hypothetical protein [Rhodocyclaceae bacterium]